MANQDIYLYATQSPPASIDTGPGDFPAAPGVTLADGTIFYTWKDDLLKSSSSGTGIFDPFLTLQRSDSQSGTNLFNGSNYATGDAISGSDNRTSLLEISKIPVVGIGGLQYLEIRLDLNEVGGGGGPKAEVRMTDLKIYGSNDPGLASFSGLSPLYSLDTATLNTTVYMWDDFNGSGRSDIVMLIPKSYFASNPQYLFFQTDFTGTDGGFEEFSTLVLQAPLDPSVEITKTADVLNADRSADSDDTIDTAGDIVTYTVSATNTGEVALTNPVLTDPLILASLDKNDDGLVNAADIVSGDTNDNGLLDVGETWIWQGEYVVTQADMNARGNYDGPDADTINDNLIRNGVAISTDEGASDDAIADTLLDYQPLVSIQKTFDVLNADRSDDADDVIDRVGDIITYTVSVKNDGNITLTDVLVTDALIAGSLDTNDDGKIDVLDITGGDVNSNGVLDVGETWTLSGEYTVTQADMDNRGNYDELGDGTNDDVIRNAASVEAKTQDQTLNATTRAYTQLDFDPLLTIQKTFDVLNADRSDDADDVIDRVGDIITYTVSVKNDGNITLTDVLVTDALIAGSLDTNDDGKIDVLDITGGDVNSNGVLDVGETWTLSGEYTVTQADMDNRGNYDGNDVDSINDNIIRNVAFATSTADNETASDDALVDTRLLYDPELAITKTANVSDVDAAGDDIVYTVTVENRGNVTLTNVLVTDPLTGLSQTIASLAPGATQSFERTYEATQADFDTNGGGDGDIDNTATADSNETEALTASAAVGLLYDPELSLLKKANVSSVDEVGDKILYTISASNTGNITLTNVTLEDTRIEDTLSNDANGDGVIDGDDGDGLLEVGETWVWTGEYTVTQADYDAALESPGIYYIRNTATADSEETGPVTSSEKVSLVEVAFEGLSPGYWKNHPTDWDGISASASFENFFFGGQQVGLQWLVKTSGKAKEKFISQQDITMQQALELTGGAEAALARQAVAAVLNSRDEDVTYRFTEAQIKEWVTEALSGMPVDLENDGIVEFAAGKAAIEGVKNLLDYNNNLELI